MFISRLNWQWIDHTLGKDSIVNKTHHFKIAGEWVILEVHANFSETNSFHIVGNQQRLPIGLVDALCPHFVYFILGDG